MIFTIIFGWLDAGKLRDLPKYSSVERGGKYDTDDEYVSGHPMPKMW